MDGPTWTKSWETLQLEAYPDPLTGSEPWTCGWGCTGSDIGPRVTWTLEEAEMRFQEKHAEAAAAAAKDLGFVWAALDPVRQAALIDMAYQNGGAGLAEFHLMLEAIAKGDWHTAQYECLRSKYHTQTRRRCEANARLLLTGEWPDVG